MVVTCPCTCLPRVFGLPSLPLPHPPLASPSPSLASLCCCSCLNPRHTAISCASLNRFDHLTHHLGGGGGVNFLGHLLRYDGHPGCGLDDDSSWSHVTHYQSTPHPDPAAVGNADEGGALLAAGGLSMGERAALLVASQEFEVSLKVALGGGLVVDGIQNPAFISPELKAAARAAAAALGVDLGPGGLALFGPHGDVLE